MTGKYMMSLVGSPKAIIGGLVTNTVTVICTKGINDAMATSQEFSHDISIMMERFDRGDWGDLDQNDITMNDQNSEQIALGNGGSVLASYHTHDGIKVWLKQDVYYGSDADFEIGKLTNTVTILFPSEY